MLSSGPVWYRYNPNVTTSDSGPLRQSQAGVGSSAVAVAAAQTPDKSPWTPQISRPSAMRPMWPRSQVGFALRRNGQVLAQYPRMAGSHAKKGQRGSLWRPTSLLPIAKRMNADRQRLRELRLRKAGESAQGDDVVASRDLSSQDAFALRPRNAAGKIPCGQLRNVVSDRLGSSTLHIFAFLSLWP